MRRFTLCLALLLGGVAAAWAQPATQRTASPQSARDSLRWEQVLAAYQTFCELAADARSGNATARTQLQQQADAISTLLKQVKGSQMTPSQQTRFSRMKQRYASVVTLPDLPALAPAPAPVQVVQGQTVVIRDTVFVIREIRQTDTVRIVEQVEKTVEVPVERVVEVPVEVPVEIPVAMDAGEPRPRTQYLLLAQAVVPDFSWGVLLGMMRTGGVWVRFDSNFHARTADYSCTSDGRTSYGQIWTTGRTERERLCLTAGGLWHPANWLTLYGGAGYGWRDLYWEDASGAWAQVSDASCRGLAADLGVVFTFDHVALSAGVNTLAFRRFDCTLGFGFLF